MDADVGVRIIEEPVEDEKNPITNPIRGVACVDRGLNSVSGMIITADGSRGYIGDPFSRRVRMFIVETKQVIAIAGDGSDACHDDSPAIKASCKYPSVAVFDRHEPSLIPEAHILILDFCCGIRRLSLPTTASAIMGYLRPVVGLMPYLLRDLWFIVCEYVAEIGALTTIPLVYPAVYDGVMGRYIGHVAQTSNGTLIVCKRDLIWAIDPVSHEWLSIAGSDASKIKRRTSAYPNKRRKPIPQFLDSVGPRARFQGIDSMVIDEIDRCCYVADRCNEALRKITLPSRFFS